MHLLLLIIYCFPVLNGKPKRILTSIYKICRSVVVVVVAIVAVVVVVAVVIVVAATAALY